MDYQLTYLLAIIPGSEAGSRTKAKLQASLKRTFWLSRMQSLLPWRTSCEDSPKLSGKRSQDIARDNQTLNLTGTLIYSGNPGIATKTLDRAII